jgi:hypothetical protein
MFAQIGIIPPKFDVPATPFTSYLTSSGGMISLNINYIQHNIQDISANNYSITSELTSTTTPTSYIGNVAIGSFLGEFSDLTAAYPTASPTLSLGVSNFSSTILSLTSTIYSCTIDYRTLNFGNNYGTYYMNGSIELKCDYGFEIPYNSYFSV